MEGVGRNNGQVVPLCEQCEGDCSHDVDCAGDLICFGRRQGRRSSATRVPGCNKGGEGDVSHYEYCSPPIENQRSYLTSKAACEEGASAMGWVDSVGSINSNLYPRGCIRLADGAIKFNRKNSMDSIAIKPCTDENHCLCTMV